MAIRERFCPGCGDQIGKGERACNYCLDDAEQEETGGGQSLE